MGKDISVILLGVIWARKAKISPAFQPLIAYLACDSFLYILDAFARLVLRNNIFGFHLSTLSDVTWLSFIFFNILPTSYNKSLKISLFIFYLMAIASAFWIDGLTTNINITSRFYGNIFLILMALFYITQVNQSKSLISLSKNRGFIFSLMVLLYYSSSFLVIITQDLPRFEWFANLNIHVSEKDLTRITLIPYPFLRAIQLGLLLHLITLFPMGVTPRHALPRWLRFRIGWRPPTENWRYRVLPPHLVG